MKSLVLFPIIFIMLTIGCTRDSANRRESEVDHFNGNQFTDLTCRNKSTVMIWVESISGPKFDTQFGVIIPGKSGGETGPYHPVPDELVVLWWEGDRNNKLTEPTTSKIVVIGSLADQSDGEVIFEFLPDKTWRAFIERD